MSSIDPFGISNIIGNTSKKIMSDKIAIMDFEGIGVSIEEIRILTQRLASKIISLNVYQLLERSQIKQLIKDRKISDCVDAACAVEIGKLVGVQHMVIGTVSKVGNTYSVDSRIIEVESGQSLIIAEYTTNTSIDDVITNGVESISHQLCSMEAPKVKKPSLFENMYKNKGIIFITWFALWIGWGLLPA